MGPLIRLLAVVASAVVALSLLLFVVDESRQSSEQQVEKVRSDSGTASTTSATDVNAPNPSAEDERVRERIHSGPREAIDDANDLLVSPFTGLAGSGSVWAQRLVPGVIALLLYGFGGLLLANFFSAPPRETRDWRETTS